MHSDSSFFYDAPSSPYDYYSNDGGGSDHHHHDYYYYYLNHHHHHRFLAAKEEEPLDYSVLSVGVMTLALLLLVEVVRHQLDHVAHGRPFFKTVLEMVYSECKFLCLFCVCFCFSQGYVQEYISQKTTTTIQPTHLLLSI